MSGVSHDLSRAIQYHRAGRLAEAERLYHAILSQEPRHVDALQLLGVLARQTGRVDLALRSLEQALKLQGPDPQLLHNQACALHDAGRVEDALRCWREAYRLRPGFAPAAIRLAQHWYQQGERDQAERILHEARQHHPNNADLNCELARQAEATGRDRDALLLYKAAVAARPNFAGAYVGGGGVWLRQRQLDNAVRWFREALRHDARSVSAWNNLGQAYQQQRSFDEAIEAYRAALRLTPDCFEVRTNLGSTLQEQGKYIEAIEVHAQSARLRPDSPVPLTHLGATYAELGQAERAFDYYDRAIALDASAAEAHMHRALLLVQHGRFAEGWDEYEWRTKTADAPRARRLACPSWDGASLANRRLLVHAEQGVGDEIMFASCLPDVIAASSHCYVTCDRRLESLLARSFPRATILGVERGQENWAALGRLADCHVAAGSLPRFVRRSESSFPSQPGYLQADQARRAVWRARLADLGPGMKVGIAWRGGIGRPRGEQRSLEPRGLTPLLRVPGVEFINLQLGPVEAEIDALRRETGARIHHFDDLDLHEELDRTAALLAELDLVVAVGSATVHLAGALGTPTWCLLPRYWGWRWLIGRSDSVWYASVRLFRQRQAGRWESVLTEVGEELWHTAARSTTRP